MWSPRVSVAVVAFVALSCGGSPRPATLSSKWVAPAILSQVPADSPYVFATLEPVDEKIRRRMLRGADQHIAKLLKAAEPLRTADRTILDPWMRAALVLADEARGKDLTTLWRDLGFDPRGRFVLYGLSVWPVFRAELADPARLRGVIDRVATAAGQTLKPSTFEGRAYWSFGSEEDTTLIAAVLERELVVAIVPTSALPTALPLVLGARPPEHPLNATSTVTELLARHHFASIGFAYLDLRRALAVMTGPTPSPLDLPLRAHIGPISPVCRADLERLVEVMPHIAFGYRRVDDAGFEATGVFEMPTVTKALKRLSTSVPEVASPVPGHPLFALGAAFKPDELVLWTRGVVAQLHDHPFACPWFAGINRAGEKLGDKLAAPLPPTTRDVRGFSVVVDDLTITPFNLEGHVLIADDHAIDLVSSLAKMIPGLSGVPVKPDGRPIELPTQQLHIPVSSAHVAMTPDRIVIAAGANSAQRAATHLASPAPRRSPLAVMAFDLQRLIALLAATGDKDVLGESSSVGNLSVIFDVLDDGLRFDVSGTWADTPAPAPTQP